jgi:transcriptional regulator with XRE-family HTH domain
MRSEPTPDAPAGGSIGTTDTFARSSEQRRGELGRFLKACRARLTPAEVGLPPGARRRTAGLRREEVAMLSGVGFTWYTWLEQGRSINVSSQVLDAVARALQLDPTERAHLYHLADATPKRAGVAETPVPTEVHAIMSGLDPLPAALINGRFDVIATNDAHADLLWNWHSMPCIHKNMLWCHLTEPTARDTMLNYDEEIPYAVARLRADYAKHIGEPEWEDDINRLSALSTEFAELWARHEVAKPEFRIRRLRNRDAGELTFAVNELELSAMPGLRIEVYTPGDEETRIRLPLTRGHVGNDTDARTPIA